MRNFVTMIVSMFMLMLVEIYQYNFFIFKLALSQFLQFHKKKYKKYFDFGTFNLTTLIQ